MTKRQIAVYAIPYLENKISALKRELKDNNNFKTHLEIAKHEQELNELYKMF